MKDKLIGGPVPCAGCGKCIVRGHVLKVGYDGNEPVFICRACYEDAEELHTSPEYGLDQFKESEGEKVDV